jgi:multicomponent Na+:H+ antiporter subunit B
MHKATDESLILQLSISLLYPFMILFGFYIIWNGYATPGGGFQGGSILATLFVARYIIYPVEDFNSQAMHLLERAFLALILILPPLLLFSGFINAYPALRVPYLRLMDILIGIEVTFGLGVAVLRFAFFKGSGEIWHL